MIPATNHAIRCYDPCLSCATHALGMMPMEIVLGDRNGERRAEIRR
jgi:coenzyme F420-reducing hydrogenase alpha subunit